MSALVSVATGDLGNEDSSPLNQSKSADSSVELTRDINSKRSSPNNSSSELQSFHHNRNAAVIEQTREIAFSITNILQEQQQRLVEHNSTKEEEKGRQASKQASKQTSC